MIRMVKNAFKNYPKDIIFIIILSVINSLTTGIGIVVLIPLLDLINISSSDIGILSAFITLFAQMSYAMRVAALLLLYVSIMLMTALITRYMSILNTKFVQKYVKQLRLKVYDSVIDADWEILTAQKHDDLLNSFTNETSKISNAMTIFPTLISIIIAAITQLSIAFALNAALTAVVIFFGSIFFFSFRNFFSIAKKNGEKMRIANRKYLGEIRNQLESINEIKSYGVEASHKEMLHEILDEYESTNVVKTKMSTLPKLLFSISSTVLIAVIFYLANVVLQVEIVELILIVYIFARIWPIFSKVHNQIQILNDALPSFDNIENTMKILNSTPKEQEPVGEPIGLDKKIVFDKVTFSYKSSEENILSNTTFTIKANAITALKGKSGVGKSTIVNLLMGLLKPTKGTIYVDDIALNNDNIRAWRKTIGYMPQDPIILNKTIRENIVRFHPNATEEEIFSALEKSQAIDFIKKLPEGIDTLMGNKGTRLSGGEQQRIALARALVSCPNVLILDEATSSLDNENEQGIQQILQSLKRNVTILIIAHKQTTINSADFVINIKENGLINITRNILI